jgi:hypothetical protein
LPVIQARQSDAPGISNEFGFGAIAMEFKKVISKEIGLQGIVPDGWSSTGDGMVARKASPQDPTRLDQRTLPQADIESVLAVGINEIILQYPTKQEELPLFERVATEVIPELRS